MNFADKTSQLKKLVEKTLVPYIDNDFVLFCLPYYTNIGDSLIWEGEIQFLKELSGYRLLYSCSGTTHCCHKIGKDIILFLQGGGNFGDVWHGEHQFKEKIITAYPDNKIIILPQTVWYTDMDILSHDVTIYSAHKNLMLCARDRNSYAFLKKHFTENTVLLVPDMAFCIAPDTLRKYQGRPTGKYLFLKRTDKELNGTISYADFVDGEDFDIRDWPTMEKQTVCVFLLRCLLWVSRKIRAVFPAITNLYAGFFFKPHMIKTGVRFVSGYNRVYTTRLHGAILCCLLGKPFVLFDNSYGKNRGFFETWFDDLDGAELR